MFNLFFYCSGKNIHRFSLKITLFNHSRHAAENKFVLGIIKLKNSAGTFFCSRIHILIPVKPYQSRSYDSDLF